MVREWRYNVHRHQAEERRHPKPRPALGYAGWITVAVIMTLPSYFWYAVFGAMPFFIFLNVIWLLTAWAIAIAGCREVAARKRTSGQ
jgi:hypothetical protein